MTFDHCKIGLDNNNVDRLADAGDDQLLSYNFGSNVIGPTCDDNGALTDDGVYILAYNAWPRGRTNTIEYCHYIP